MKKCIIAVLLLTMVLTGCGNIGGGQESATSGEKTSNEDSTAQAEMPDTLGEGKTYKAEDLNNLYVTSNPLESSSGDIENAADGTFTIYDNHTLVYTDGSGKSMNGFLLSGFSLYGYEMPDMIVLIDQAAGSSVYLENLQYLNDARCSVPFEEATAIQFYESEETGTSSTVGDLVMIGASADNPDLVYLLFMQPENIPEGYTGGTCYAYSISGGDYKTYSWWGENSDISPSLTVSIDVQETQSNVFYGSFSAVYASLSGSAETVASNDQTSTADPSVEVSSSFYYAFDQNKINFDPERLSPAEVKEQATDHFTLYSNNLAVWEDENGQFWRGFYFKGFTDNGYDYLRFQNEKEIEIEGTWVLERVTGSDAKEDGLVYSVMQVSNYANYPSFVGTASSVAPNMVFILYGDSASGNVSAYDYSEDLFYEGSWWLTDGSSSALDESASLDPQDPQNVFIHLNYKDTEYEIGSFDPLN